MACISRGFNKPSAVAAVLLLIVLCQPARGDVAGPFVADGYPSSYEPLPRNDVMITNVVVLDGTGGRRDDADILIREGRIASVGPNLEQPEGVAIVDGRGRWVTPGIIDVHSHAGTYYVPLSQSLSDISETSSPVVAETWIEHAVNAQDPAFAAALRGGVTTVQVLPGSVSLFGGRSVVLKTVPGRTVYDMKFPEAPQGLKMACGENPKSAFGEKGVAPTSRQGEIAAMRAAWTKAADYLRKWREFDSGNGDPPVRDLALDTLAGVLAGDIRVHLHCYRADDIVTLLNVSREFGFAISTIHHAGEAYKVAGMLEDHDVCAAVWSDWWGFKMEIADGIRENAAYLSASGVCTIMHSDSPFVGQRLVLEAAKAMAAGKAAGLSVDRAKAITWVTGEAARALGLEDRIGSVASGLNADLVLWSGDPFSIYTQVDRVYVDGAVAYDREDASRQPRSDLLLGYPVFDE